MTDLFVIIIIGIILFSAIMYIIKQKKAGVRCIGCSQAGMCSKKMQCDTNPLVSKYKNEEAV